MSFSQIAAFLAVAMGAASCNISILSPTHSDASATCNLLCGDVDNSGTVTVTDQVKVLRFAAELDVPDACQAIAADANGDGSITVTDGVLVARAAAGLQEITCSFQESVFKPTTLGFNYGVPIDRPMSSNEREKFARDLSFMKGLGVDRVRLIVFGPATGLNYHRCENDSAGCPGGILDHALIDRVVANLTSPTGPLETFARYDIGVDLMFWANSYYWDMEWSPLYWELYGDTPDAWQRFTWEVGEWVSQIANRVEATAVGRRAVRWYDVWNEYDDYGVARNSGQSTKRLLLEKIFSKMTVSSSRLGLSILEPCQADEIAEFLTSRGYQLGMVDTHNYPGDYRYGRQSCGYDKDTGTGAFLGMIQQAFPNATSILGELAAPLHALDENQNPMVYSEDYQADLDTRAFWDASQAGAESVLRWALWDWDQAPMWGLGGTMDTPRDILGRYTDIVGPVNLIPTGGDFESSGSADYWERVGESTSLYVASTGSGFSAATGQSFLRVSGRGEFGVCSPVFSTGPHPSVGITAMIRGSVDEPGVEVRVVQDVGSVHSFSRVSGLSPSTFANIQSFFPYGITLTAQPLSRVKICFVNSDAGGGNRFFDLDAVSVNTFGK